MRLLLASSLCAVGLLLAGAATTAANGAQVLAGVQANWKDLETWSRPDPSARQSELGLGLHPIGGAVVAFLGRLSLTDPNRPAADVRVHVAPAYMANPNVLRRATLVFTADLGSDRPAIVDVSASLITDDVSAGGIIQNAIGTMRAADFLRLARAERLVANVLGFDVAFRPEQIRAMRELAARLHLR
ncbi:MAG: hypothetical protein IT184_18315 [Acidobacteria bacterium]|nr:hypothetical protein [Acidobacteriota bacterium]